LRRVIETSKGPLALDVSHIFREVEISAQMFDGEGWEQTDARWKDGKGPLGAYLASTFGLTAEEADAIARETLEQWGARGGRHRDRFGFAGGFILFLIIGMPILGFLAIVTLVVLLLFRVI
jgi:hypothetical protein